MKEVLEVQENDKLLTVKDLGRYIPFGKNKLYKLVNSDDFPKITIGRTILIPKKNLDEWINSHLYKKYDL